MTDIERMWEQAASDEKAMAVRDELMKQAAVVCPSCGVKYKTEHCPNPRCCPDCG